MNRPSLQQVVSSVVGLVFVFAGLTKIIDSSAFFSDLLGYGLPVPEQALRWVAITLPWSETICGLFLVANVWPETVRPLVALLCLGFVCLLSQALLRGLDPRCGCFGNIGLSWFERADVALVRALLLLAASLYLVSCLSGALKCDQGGALQK